MHLRRLSASAQTARARSQLHSLGSRSHILRFSTVAATKTDPSTTNIGYARLAFNIGYEDNIVFRARVFDTAAGRGFLASLPHAIGSLQSYGEEVYGPWNVALPCATPVPYIPPGGLAFSEQGQFLCIFFGQAPAWPVEYFAQIEVGHEQLQGGRWLDVAVTKEDPLAMESY